MYKSYRMSNTEQDATVGSQMVAGIHYRNGVATAASHNHAYRGACGGDRLASTRLSWGRSLVQEQSGLWPARS